MDTGLVLQSWEKGRKKTFSAGILKMASGIPSLGKKLGEQRITRWKDEEDNNSKELMSSVDDQKFLARQKRKLSEHPVVNKIIQAKRSSLRPVGFFRRVFIICSTSACFTILLTLFMFIPLSKAVVGLIFIDECQAEPLIPLYLLVGGIIACVRDIANMCLRSNCTDENYIEYEIPITLIAFFYTLGEFAWFIYGSTVVYRTMGQYQPLDKTKENYCNVVLYMFAFVVTSISYVIMAVIIISCCATICLTRFLEEEEENKNVAVIVVQVS